MGGDFAAARKSFKRTVRLDPTHAEARSQLKALPPGKKKTQERTGDGVVENTKNPAPPPEVEKNESPSTTAMIRRASPGPGDLAAVKLEFERAKARAAVRRPW